MWGGDAAIGTAISPPFTIDGSLLRLRVAGGTDPKLRIELRVGDDVVRTAGVPAPASEAFRDRTWDVTDLRGKTVRIVAIDDATGSWGHLSLDEIWLLP